MSGLLLRRKLMRSGGATPAAAAYVKLSAPSSFSLSTTKKWNGTMEYSTDGENWSTWGGSSISGTEICLRGTGNTTVANSTAFSITGSSVSVEGNIEALLDYETVIAGSHPTMNTDCFRSLFASQTSLTDASRLLLPAVTLSEGCYRSMFYGCTKLTKPPTILPATTLAPSCYQTMFYNSGITVAPELPATTLATNCYYNMFSECTALTNAPALPATTLAESCYYCMFYGCTALTNAPALPATTLATSCYYRMFYGCTALTNAPALPATDIPVFAYAHMFINTNLKISSTPQTGYNYEFRYPITGTATGDGSTDTYMFNGTGGVSNPTPNTTYYANFPSVA